MKLFDNSQQFGDVKALEHKRVGTSCGDNAENVIDAAHHFTDTIAGEEKPLLVDARTTLETETLWKRRLKMLLDAENNLIKVIRLRKITGIFTVASMAMFLFSLYVAPTMSPALFYGLFALSVFGFVTYPAWLVASKSNKKQRDAISRMFYMSNHEVDMSDGKITLINRANYANVTHINVLERELGQLANS
ncbi:hypothetical protein LHL20_12020 [Alteromonas sp. McT4-15]|uniref:hypothetical protein n=1 Tax=Alteromonas sp. McT4-15 TaxID=2881256 RepID=UPI001CF84524|nr:hypothetical protein [Alteromonas sp. McT4-15]MCB4436951.1 hypothetical protein [Alteromonas sp. McT4-15]